jgi:hypothetical protein
MYTEIWATLESVLMAYSKALVLDWYKPGCYHIQYILKSRKGE